MSETEDVSFTEIQNKRFKTIIEIFKNIGIDPPYKHIANSAAVINFPESCHTMVRAGLLSYGIYTADNLKEKIKLKTGQWHSNQKLG